MKKLIGSAFLVFVAVIFLTGCGSEKTITCSYESDQSASGYKLTSEYKIYH